MVPVKVAIAADFLSAYARVPRSQQRKVLEFITRFQHDPTASSINYEKIMARDERVRTVRIDRKYRAIVLHPKRGDVYVLVWVDNHDEAMAWAQNKLFPVNPHTGALQVVDAALAEQAEQALVSDEPETEYTLFFQYSDEELLQTGLPELLIPAIRAIQTVEQLEKLEPHLPAEAFEALAWVAEGFSLVEALAEAGSKVPSQPVDTEDLAAAISHPNSQRRFATVDSADELLEMLQAPLEKWRVFLHPSQARLVKATFNGPARVLGGAGTGKTVVAMHRARHLARHIFTAATDRILFTTFTRNLANNISENLETLCQPETFKRIEVTNLHRWAMQFLRKQGIQPQIASDDEIDICWRNAIAAFGRDEWDQSFYESEWADVVRANGISSLASYVRTPRRGQKSRLSRQQRVSVWEVLAEYRRQLEELGKVEIDDLISETAQYLQQNAVALPYRAIIVDESQDLTAVEFKLLRQLVPEGQNDLFFVGDAHQRIYGKPVVMSHCGIQIVGRSRKLRINYRTTEEIRNFAVSVLAEQLIDDMDGGKDNHRGYLSLRNGQPPVIRKFGEQGAEVRYLVETVTEMITSDVDPHEICVVARISDILRQYGDALKSEGVELTYLDRDTREKSGRGIRLATMHRVKGLEFPYIFVVSAKDGVIPRDGYNGLPLSDDEMLAERCLLHVAASRARDQLTITYWGEPSPFLQ